MTTLLTNPMAVVRTRMMMNHAVKVEEHGNKSKSGVAKVAQEIWRKEGRKGFGKVLNFIFKLDYFSLKKRKMHFSFSRVLFLHFSM